MQNYRKTSHTTYDCKYHIVWITKYRKKVLGGEVGKRVRELVREICKRNDVEILKGRHLWGRGYFVATSGNITDEMIMEYIKNQDNNEKEDGEFTIVD